MPFPHTRQGRHPLPVRFSSGLGFSLVFLRKPLLLDSEPSTRVCLVFTELCVLHGETGSTGKALSPPASKLVKYSPLFALHQSADARHVLRETSGKGGPSGRLLRRGAFSCYQVYEPFPVRTI
jgi:hypothetical protein